MPYTPKTLTGFSTEQDNSFVVRKLIGFSAEIENNLFVTVLSADGSPLNTASIKVEADSGNLIDTQSLVETDVDENARFQMFIDNAVTITISVFDVIEGERSTSITHDGVSNFFVTISFVPTILRFPEVNPMRVVITESPLVIPGKLSNTMYDDQPDPFFEADRYNLKVKKNQIQRLQFISNYIDSNTAKVFNMDGIQVGTIFSAVPKVDLLSNLNFAFIRYEFAFDFSGFDDGEYYIEFEGSDIEQGLYKARSETFFLALSHRSTIEIEYFMVGKTNTFDVDYTTDEGLKYKIYVEGEFWRTKYGGESDQWMDDSYDTRITKAVRRKHGLLKIYGVPHYILDKINLALKHDVCRINGQDVKYDGDLEPVMEEDLSLVKAEAWIPYQEAFINRT